MERTRKAISDEEQNNVDRLSDLPDGVICHILCFLSTKESVRTSVLAKRWMTLWAHVPVVDFNYWEYFGSRRKSFPTMVCAFMLRHKAQSLDTFRFAYNDCDVDVDSEDDDDDGPCNYEVETCIAVVVERNVRNLNLESRLIRVEVPRCLLTCKTLVDLTMAFDVSIPPSSGPIYLPNLKKLHLRCLKCEVDYTHLLSGCSVLEELIIKVAAGRDPRSCSISSPTLKRLTFHHLLDRSMLNNVPDDYLVTIHTPALGYLCVFDNCSGKHISISPCTSLVEADIRFDSLCEPGDFDQYHRCVLKLLDGICNVKCLQLTGSCDKICDGLMSGSISKFGNLTKLELWVDWRLLLKFLESADHLQVLTICEDPGDSEHWRDPVDQERCGCVLHSLRTVRINNFRCTEQGFNMVRYILRNAQVLERLEIDCPHEGVDAKIRFDAIQKIRLFHRESKECELYFP